jgi:hypothetical protein
MFYPSYATTGHAQDVHFLGDIQSTTMEKIVHWVQVRWLYKLSIPEMST